MSTDCRQFRELLARALEGGAAGPLAWHEHLLFCAPCRELLAAEEALDQLLATLPEPRLPRSMVERVLRRLRAGRALDRLLDLDSVVEAPSDLSRRVLASLAAHRPAAGAPEPVAAEADADAKLDRLLARDARVALPERLVERVLASLAGERNARSSAAGALAPLPAVEAQRAARLLGGPRPRIPAPAPLVVSPRAEASSRRVLYAAAATLLVVVAGWRLGSGPAARTDDELAGLDRLSIERDAALLGELDVLERLDLLMDPDLDLVIASELEPETELALAFAR